ncbi:MAG: A/G-specific adenine glycosylase [Thermoproteota archaeon]
MQEPPGGLAASIVERLLEWWRRNKRSFPWRETGDPYRLLLAAILLRKTRAENVAPVYAALVERYPEPQRLAEASVEELEELLRPLGLHRTRARQLARLARELVERYGGRVPCAPEELAGLPGVGPYAANVVGAAACGRRVAAVDVNVARVVSRLFGVKPRRAPHLDEAVLEAAQRLVEAGPPRDVNLALMDLSAKLCRPRRPRCWECPLRELCSYAGSQAASRGAQGR